MMMKTTDRRDELRIELNKLSYALSRCTDQAECDRMLARMEEIDRCLTSISSEPTE